MKLIDEKTLTELLQSEAELCLLNNSGVDNWEYWGEARQGGEDPDEDTKNLVKLADGDKEQIEKCLKDFQDA